MIRLALDTALASCSAALFEDDRLLAAAAEVIGRGHAERLLPLVSEVMAAAGVTRADEILVDVGPGSFTGIRVGVAAARALGFAWGAEVRGFMSTSMVAAAAFADSDVETVLIALEAGRGELYCQRFGRAGAADVVAALSPEAAVLAARGLTVAGSGAAALTALDPTLRVVGPSWPSACDLPLLRRDDCDLPPQPLYVRAPDAMLPA